MPATSLPNEVTNLKANVDLLLSDFVDERLNYHQAAAAASKRLRVTVLEQYHEEAEPGHGGHRLEYLVLTTEDTTNMTRYQFRFSGRNLKSETERERYVDIPKTYRIFDVIEYIKGPSPNFNREDKLLATLLFSAEPWPVYLYEMVFLIKAVISVPVNPHNLMLLLSPDFAAGLTLEMSKRIFKGVFSSYDSERGWWQVISTDCRVPAARMMDDIKPRYDGLVLNSGLKNENGALNEHLLSDLLEGQIEVKAQLKAVDTALRAHEAFPREERTNILTAEVVNTLKDGFSRLDKRQTQVEAELQTLRMALRGDRQFHLASWALDNATEELAVYTEPAATELQMSIEELIISPLKNVENVCVIGRGPLLVT
ncbi:hypothetical protein H0H93_008904 [Arthromyces matolae]|nr:hypothetical protein H0H93_008904 [Arthromyces matolae]